MHLANANANSTRPRLIGRRYFNVKVPWRQRGRFNVKAQAQGWLDMTILYKNRQGGGTPIAAGAMPPPHPHIMPRVRLFLTPTYLKKVFNHRYSQVTNNAISRYTLISRMRNRPDIRNYSTGLIRGIKPVDSLTPQKQGT